VHVSHGEHARHAVPGLLCPGRAGREGRPRKPGGCDEDR
jgi:hypothetical protein